MLDKISFHKHFKILASKPSVKLSGVFQNELVILKIMSDGYLFCRENQLFLINIEQLCTDSVH